MHEWISGRNPVMEALRAQRRKPYRLLLATGVQEKGRLQEILNLASQRRLPVERLEHSQLDQRFPNNQGVALEVDEYPYADLADILERARQRSEPPFLIILDTLQDPQNLGTLLRTAEAVGVHGVLLPFKHTATVTPAVVHASSGACEHLLIAQANLAQTIDQLKKMDIWVVGLEGSTQALPPERVRLDVALALVVGSEGEGMRPLVRRACDILMSLPMRGQIESLNAAVAGSIALYLAWQSRRAAGLSSG